MKQNMGKDQGEERGKKIIEIGGCKITTTEKGMEGGV